MSFKITYSAEDLRDIADKQKREEIVQFIENYITPFVLDSAKDRKTSYFWQRFIVPVFEKRIPTNEDLVIALKQKFPGTRVEAQETWIEVEPRVKHYQKGILIDWS